VRRRDPLAQPAELARCVYAYAAYQLGPGPDAEDVTRETFQRAVRNRKSYDPSEGTPAYWMLRIARRVIAERPAQAAVTPIEASDRGELGRDPAIQAQLLSAMSRLPDDDRELLALRHGAGLTESQVAEMLGERAEMVELDLHRALEQLQTILDPQSSDEIDLAV
jgi:RNA polymerase sigma-70 factor (ECF subfamily)